MRLQADYYELATATSGWFFGLVTLNSAVLPLLCLYQLKNPKNPGRTKKKPPEGDGFFWAHLDLNQGPTDYESAALTN
jgi:hypothetical protein